MKKQNAGDSNLQH